MHRHPHFDLWLHDDDELRPWLGDAVVAREPLHAWPLSCVQRLHLAGGGTCIYKVQAPPTVEPEFYAQASGALLVHAQVIHQPGRPAALLLEEIAAPRLCDLKLTPAQVNAMGWEVVAQVAALGGELPAVAELCTPAQWAGYAGALVERLAALVTAGTFTAVDEHLVRRIATLAARPAVQDAFATPIGYVHGDMTASNLFVGDDGYRLVDWQRPLRGPVALDVTALLDSAGLEPGEFIAPGIVQLFYLLRIGWFAACAYRWFLPGAPTYDAAIVRLVERIDALGEREW